MGAGHDRVLRARDQRALFVGRVAPQQEDHALRLPVEVRNDAIGERLPSPAAVRLRFVRAHGKDRVEQQHPLARPRLKVPVVRSDETRNVRGQFTVDVAQRTRHGPVPAHRKAKSMSVTGSRIRILSEQENTDVLVGCEVECGEDFVRRRKHGASGGGFFGQEAVEILKVGLRPLGVEQGVPGRGEGGELGQREGAAGFPSQTASVPAASRKTADGGGAKTRRRTFFCRRLALADDPVQRRSPATRPMTLKHVLIALGLLSSAASSPFAQEAAPAAAAPAPTAKSELDALVARINAQLRAGKNTPEALAEELAAFDALSAKYGSDKSEEAAQILMMKGALYAQALKDTVKGTALLQQVAVDFPGTKAAANAGRMLAMMEKQAQAKVTQAALVGKTAPNLDFTWRSDEGPKTLDGYKGKVVILDFWATWCGPCIASFPNVAEVVKRYEGYDVAVVGVTSLQGFVSGLEGGRVDTKGDPEKEMALMKDFMKAKAMTWTVAFSQQEVFNPDYGILGIPYVAIIAPDGTVRHAGLHPGGSLAEKAEKIDAILKEFKLKVPATPAKSS